MKESRIATLVLYADYTTRLSYYDDWLDAFGAAADLKVEARNICRRDAVRQLTKEIRDFDLVVLLHSTNGDTTAYLEPLVGVLTQRRGLLLSFVGNEVNLPGSPIAAKRAVLRAIGADFVATQLPLEAGRYLWGDVAARAVVPVPHALNPAAFRPQVAAEDRPIDIGVRAVRYLAHLGDDDRNRLHDLFATQDFGASFAVDVSDERLDRAGWAKFLNRCKGTVSSEAGGWFLERDDKTIEAIRAWTADRFAGQKFVIANDSPLRKLGHKLPWWARSLARKALSRGALRHESSVNEEIAFSEIFDLFFKDRARPEFYAKCISSRHFDAIGTGTCQILMEGRYNDILSPDRHYIALAKDFHNLASVMERFRDEQQRGEIARAAREYVMDEHTYAHRISTVCAVVRQ